jgi:hypothetical protein
VQAQLSRPLYVYLVWIDSEGKATPFHPWPIGRWNELPDEQTPVTELSLPSQADEGWPLIGPAGMETFMVLARKEPLPRHADLAVLFRDLPKQDYQEPNSLVWFAEGMPITTIVDEKRGPRFFSTRQLDDPVLQTQGKLNKRLSELFPMIRSVSFAKQGELDK